MGARAFLFSVLLGLGTQAAADGLYPSETEFGAETLSIVAATEALFDAIEAESAGPVTDTPRLQLRIVRPGAEPVSLPAAGRGALRDDLGPVEHLTAYNITWYPTDTLSGTVDFLGSWDGGRNLVCGYVTWDMTNADTPVLAAMTTSYLDTASLLRLSPDIAHVELLRANCAFGDIEANLELLRPEPHHFP